MTAGVVARAVVTVLARLRRSARTRGLRSLAAWKCGLLVAGLGCTRAGMQQHAAHTEGRRDEEHPDGDAEEREAGHRP